MGPPEKQVPAVERQVRRDAVDGLVIIDKPAGLTSHDVVARCRRIFSQHRAGHAGTLDPDATGVLLVGLGRATRLMRFLSGLPKRYTAEVVLGAATSTLDSGGELTGTWDMRGVTISEARAAAAGLTGDVWQLPPMVSALKVGGSRLHQLARAGIEVRRAPRQIQVTRFELTLAPDQDAGFAGAGPVLAVDVECSSGTYVRALAADLGAALGGGACLRRLRRHEVGSFSADEAVELEFLSDPSTWQSAVLSLAEALRGMQRVVLGAVSAAGVGHGKILPLEELRAAGAAGTGPWAVVGEDGGLLAVYEVYGPEQAKPSVVVAGAGLAGAEG